MRSRDRGLWTLSSNWGLAGTICQLDDNDILQSYEVVDCRLSLLPEGSKKAKSPNSGARFSLYLNASLEYSCFLPPSSISFISVALSIWSLQFINIVRSYASTLRMQLSVVPCLKDRAAFFSHSSLVSVLSFRSICSIYQV